METKRQLSVLENQLKETGAYICGHEYTIADMAIWPWYGSVVLGNLYGDAAVFLNVANDYPLTMDWARRIAERPAVRRGRIVNRTWGDVGQLAERHCAQDIDEALIKAEDEQIVKEGKLVSKL